MRVELLSWSEKWNLVDDWCLEAAVETLAGWAVDPQALQDSDMHFRPFAQMAPMLGIEGDRFTFTHPGWQPTLRRWSDVKKEMEAAFRHRLAEYEAIIRQAADDEGWVLTHETRLRKGDPMDWVVLRVLDALPYGDIADQVGVTRQRVEKQVPMIAGIMGLTLPILANHRNLG
jgi:hypothetical protein